jgi:hypothetical protein
VSVVKLWWENDIPLSQDGILSNYLSARYISDDGGSATGSDVHLRLYHLLYLYTWPNPLPTRRDTVPGTLC